MPRIFRKTGYRDSDCEGRAGRNRLLRAGLKMAGAATILWLVVVGLARMGWNGGSDPMAQVLMLTFTILLWPFATLGLLMVICGLVIKVAGSARSLSR